MSKFVHMELNTSDPEAAQKFYKAIFGWKFPKMKMADGSVYIGIANDEGGIGGIQKNPNPKAPPAWVGYVGVESVKRTIAKVEKNGGKVIMPQMDIPNMGSLAVFADPQGAVFAIWQPAAKPADVAAAPAAAPKKAPAAKAPAAKAAAPAPAAKAAKKVAAAPAPAAKAAKKVAAAPAPAAKPAKKVAKK